MILYRKHLTARPVLAAFGEHAYPSTKAKKAVRSIQKILTTLPSSISMEPQKAIPPTAKTVILPLRIIAAVPMSSRKKYSVRVAWSATSGPAYAKRPTLPSQAVLKRLTERLQRKNLGMLYKRKQTVIIPPPP